MIALGLALALVLPPLSVPGERKNVLLSGGVHGDEPAGVHAIEKFVEEEAKGYTGKFRFFIFPKVNPSGLEKIQLANAHGHNVNRKFYDGTDAPEAQAVIKQLKAWNVRFVFAIDMHEIPPYYEGEGFTKKDNPHAAYLYETQVDPKKRIGRKMIEELPKDIEVCQWPKIYGDKADRGLVTYPEGNLNAIYAQGTSLDSYVHKHYSDHTFTAETPTGWPLEKRVRAHLSWLRTALNSVK